MLAWPRNFESSFAVARPPRNSSFGRARRWRPWPVSRVLALPLAAFQLLAVFLPDLCSGLAGVLCGFVFGEALVLCCFSQALCGPLCSVSENLCLRARVSVRDVHEDDGALSRSMKDECTYVVSNSTTLSLDVGAPCMDDHDAGSPHCDRLTGMKGGFCVLADVNLACSQISCFGRLLSGFFAGSLAAVVMVLPLCLLSPVPCNRASSVELIDLFYLSIAAMEHMAICGCYFTSSLDKGLGWAMTWALPFLFWESLADSLGHFMNRIGSAVSPRCCRYTHCWHLECHLLVCRYCDVFVLLKLCCDLKNPMYSLELKWHSLWS
ncbi:hypothetical protein Nepgr_019563 [Nepenthes gracilis]|uniref:Uncharacterized protein n=1 Tax=Nepenthes gracilis TaxID=150966 RepID=A0AAD3SVA6_NEPGR|nr:hypothetical protein Nepgr_019563 [Nepenthes gracilis]